MSVPTEFSWPAGPGGVQVSGDWDSWAAKTELDKHPDGSFSKSIPMPANKRIHFKYIVDDNWVTKDGTPTVNDNGNVNNVQDIGDAPKNSDGQSTEDKAKAAAGGALAGAGAAAAGAAAAVTTAVTGGKDGRDQLDKKTDTPPVVENGLKKSEPGQPLKEAADGDVRNALPESVTNASHTVIPAVAGALATVTGADIMRGNPQELTPSPAEAKQAQEDSAQKAAGASTMGGFIVDPKQAPNDNAKAGANTATAAAAANKLETPAVAVGDAGFAASVDPAREVAAKEGGDAAGAVASRGESQRATANQDAPGAVAAVPLAGSSGGDKKSAAEVPATSLPGTTSTVEYAEPINRDSKGTAASQAQAGDKGGVSGAVAGAAVGAGAAGVAAAATLSGKDDSQKASQPGAASSAQNAPDALASGQTTYGVPAEGNKGAAPAAAAAAAPVGYSSAKTNGAPNTSSVPPGVKDENDDVFGSTAPPAGLAAKQPTRTPSPGARTSRKDDVFSSKTPVAPPPAPKEEQSKAASSQPSNDTSSKKVGAAAATGAAAVTAVAAGAVAAASDGKTKQRADQSSRGQDTSSGNALVDDAKLTSTMAPAASETTTKDLPSAPGGARPAPGGRTSSNTNGAAPRIPQEQPSTPKKTSGRNPGAHSAIRRQESTDYGLTASTDSPSGTPSKRQSRFSTLKGRRKSNLNLFSTAADQEPQPDSAPTTPKKKGLFGKIKEALGGKKE